MGTVGVMNTLEDVFEVISNWLRSTVRELLCHASSKLVERSTIVCLAWLVTIRYRQVTLVELNSMKESWKVARVGVTVGKRPFRIVTWMIESRSHLIQGVRAVLGGIGTVASSNGKFIVRHEIAAKLGVIRGMSQGLPFPVSVLSQVSISHLHSLS